MKVLLFTLLCSLASSANTHLQVYSLTPLHSYNHKPSMKLQKQREYRSLAKVKENEAMKIAVYGCNEEIKLYKLTHKRQLLFYRIYTQNCKIEINALDGSIISKVML